MCGRYALGLRPAQVRDYLAADAMPAYEAPPDEGDEAPRYSYNFAPGYNGIVYRADVPDYGAGPAPSHSVHLQKSSQAPTSDTSPTDTSTSPDPAEQHQSNTETDENVQYKLQSMRWGLIPSWTKRNPDYSHMLKTINCRDDSLAQSTGLWNAIKPRKRCIVVCQGFYEWLAPAQAGGKKIPHFVKRKDGKLMCMAGLWDCVRWEDEKSKSGGKTGHAADDEGVSEDDGLASLTSPKKKRNYHAHGSKTYTYTIITTSTNPTLRFLHDRMPVILDNGSVELYRWLSPSHHVWSKELQALLKPYEGELEVYPVTGEVGKVGNNSERFIVPVGSRANKANIANWFSNAGASPKKAEKLDNKGPGIKNESENKTGAQQSKADIKHEDDDSNTTLKTAHTSSTSTIKAEPTSPTSSPSQAQNSESKPTPQTKRTEQKEDDRVTIDHTGTEDNAPLPIPKSELSSSDTLINTPADMHSATENSDKKHPRVDDVLPSSPQPKRARKAEACSQVPQEATPSTTDVKAADSIRSADQAESAEPISVSAPIASRTRSGRSKDPTRNQTRSPLKKGDGMSGKGESMKITSFFDAK